ncbi:MAG: hypothetical protein LBT80_02655 [Lactobacillaceae bacterium]|jgi:hypothetical protein|nr:hypothetical protein [Lactobacillaceae bacterium]
MMTKIFNWLLNKQKIIGIFIGFIVILAFFIVFILANPFIRQIVLLNGDSLTLPIIFNELFAGKIADFNFFTQTFVFPELFLYLPCYLIGKLLALKLGIAIGMMISLMLNTILDMGIVMWLFYCISRTIVSSKMRALYSSLVGVTLLAAMHLMWFWSKVTDFSSNIAIDLTNTYYYGAVISGLLILILIIKIFQLNDYKIENAKLIRNSILLVIISALTTLSDQLFIIFVVAPSLLCMTLFLIKQEFKPYKFIFSMVPLLLGVVLAKVFLKISKIIVPSEDMIGRSTTAQWIDYFHTMSASHIWLITFGVCVVFALIAIMIGLLKLRNKQFVPAIMLLFAGSAPIVNGMIIVGLGMQVTGRYFITFWLYPLILMVYLVATVKNNIICRIINTLTVVTLFILFSFTCIESRKNVVLPVRNTYVQQVIKLANKTGDKPFAILGDYFQIRAIDLYSDNKIVARQARFDGIDKKMKEHIAQSTSDYDYEFHYYLSSRSDDRTFAAEYPPDKIYKLAGPEGYQVWYYKHNILALKK